MEELQEECVICLEGITETDSKMLLCDHRFHNTCISLYIAYNDFENGVVICPICRTLSYYPPSWCEKYGHVVYKVFIGTLIFIFFMTSLIFTFHVI
jgi:hypothetical protein